MSASFITRQTQRQKIPYQYFSAVFAKNIAKLHAPNFDMNALNFILDYLTKREQRVKINSSFSSYLDISQGVLQGSILGPLVFNFFVIYSYFLRKLIL